MKATAWCRSISAQRGRYSRTGGRDSWGPYPARVSRHWFSRCRASKRVRPRTEFMPLPPVPPGLLIKGGGMMAEICKVPPAVSAAASSTSRSGQVGGGLWAVLPSGMVGPREVSERTAFSVRLTCLHQLQTPLDGPLSEVPAREGSVPPDASKR